MFPKLARQGKKLIKMISSIRQKKQPSIRVKLTIKNKDSIRDDVEDNIIPYSTRIVTAKKTPDGLYPPEVLMINFCRRQSKPSSIPKYYWYRHGIELKDVPKMQESLSRRGFIARNTKGVWDPTEKGRKSLELNGDIVFVHKYYVYKIDEIWDVQKILSRVKISGNSSWIDRMWHYCNNCIMKYSTKDILVASRVHYTQAQLAKLEGKNDLSDKMIRQAEKDKDVARDVIKTIFERELKDYKYDGWGSEKIDKMAYLHTKCPENITTAAQLLEVEPFTFD